MSLEDLAKERAAAHRKYRGLCNTARYLTDCGIALAQLGLKDSDEAEALRAAFRVVARKRDEYYTVAFGLKPLAGHPAT